MIGILMSLIYGAIAGWLANTIMGGKSSLIRNIVIGVIGGFVGGFLFQILGFYASGVLANMIVSVVGACVFIFIGRRLF